jgi:PD-(D/E)XK nuclease superfamily
MSFAQYAEPLPFPKLRQSNTSIGRVYHVVTGPQANNVYPSITRILAARPKPGLDAWKKRVGAAEAARVSVRATTQGSSIHKLTECFLGNLDLPQYSASVAELWQHLRPWLSNHVQTVYAQEQDVYSDRLKVAGRMDLLAEADFALTVLDVKTSARPKIDAYVEDYFLQGTFYACATYELTGLKVKNIVLPIVHPGGVQVFECPAMKHFDELRRRIDEYYETYAIDEVTV